MAPTNQILCFSLLLVLPEAAMYAVCPPKCTCTENEDMSNLRGTQLIDVDCKKKGLSSLPELDLLENVTIHRLYLDGNRITSIEGNAFDGFMITGIELSDNPLSHISPDAFKGLEYYMEYLSMQRISLNHQPRQFLNGLTMLRTLDLTGVSTPVMHKLSNGTFGTLRMLETLVLTDCDVTSIHEEAFVGVESMMELRLDSNRLSSIPVSSFRPLMELRTLNLDQNQISTLPRRSFVTLMNLQKLSLSHNELSDVTKIENGAFLGIGHNLMELDLSFNGMTKLPTHTFDNLFNLGTFKVSNNEIHNLKNGTFEKMSHLMTLDLSGNLVKLMPGMLRGLEMSLVNLLLANTGITSDTIPVDALKRLRYLRQLDLSGNQLETLTNASFSGLAARQIRLSNCRITSIDSDTFSRLQTPLDVELNYNNIENVNFLTDSCLFEKLDLSDNPLDCDCDFLNIVKQRTTKFVGKCDSPQEVSGEEITTASENEDIVELCEWQNQTETVVKCDWMSSGTCSTYTGFMLSALGLVMSILFIMGK